MKPYFKTESVRIYCGDAREVIAALPPRAFDAVLFDPPFSSGARRDANRQTRGSMLRKLDDSEWFGFDAMTTWGFTWFMRGLALDLRNAMIPGGYAWCFSDWRQGPNVFGIFESAGWRVNHQIVWDKIDFGMGSTVRNQHELITFASNGKPNEIVHKKLGTVLHYKAPHSSVRLHPTEKPVALLEELLGATPFNRVIDPTMGSGSTLEAAVRLGKKAIGIDVDPNACEIAKRRIRQLSLPGM